ncbi:MAG: ribulose bisphosphate carboxylase small subunit [Elainellaceae cyanobacterium]
MAYYISPCFLDKLAVHITKNFLELPGVRVPLILGIHGRKGEGKTFQCELVFERMGIETVHISGGELESPDAGDPARLLRLRYREAAELVRVRGRMVALMINDLDVGAGRFDEGTQYTVNTQLVNGTLMNIADNPTNVQLPGSYDDNPIRRVPIIVTGNDFTTLYAPLVRDGRMEKFYWEPDRSDRIGIVGGIFEPDGLPRHEIENLVDSFPNQSVDFFSALRAQVYDEQVRNFIHQIGVERISMRVVNSEDGPPNFPKPDFSIDHLHKLATGMVAEQRRIQDMRLGREYNQALNWRVNQHQNGEDIPKPESIAQPSTYFSHPSSKPSGGNGSRGDQSSSQPTHASASSGSQTLSPDTIQQIHNLLAQGYRVGMEHVDERRFRMNSWKSCASVSSTHESDVVSQLEDCLNQHQGEYVRLIGIDPRMKKRVLETIIQRPA